VICGSDLAHDATGLRQRDEICRTESTMVLAGRQPRGAGLSRDLCVVKNVASGRPMCVSGEVVVCVGTTPAALAVNEPQAMPGPFGRQGVPADPSRRITFRSVRSSSPIAKVPKASDTLRSLWLFALVLLVFDRADYL
jgi:hypothetical protein